MITREQIVMAVCEVCDVRSWEIYGPSKEPDICLARYMLGYLMRDLLNLSSVKIGKALERDHSTVLYWFKKFDQMLDNENEIRSMYENALIRLSLEYREAA